MGDRLVRSFPFLVGGDLLESHTISDVLAYFKGQRSDGVKDRADRTARFEGLEGVTVDAHGGWYDATGDYGKHLSHLSFSTWFNPQQLPLVPWSLLTARELLAARSDRNFRQIERRLLDEAMVGADYLVRVHRAGGGVAIAALAMASAAPVSGDLSNADYLKVAEEAFAYWEYANSPGGICNGITAGMQDEHGIDFQLPYEVTGGDNDWRWGEQWLPHASWYLAAVAAR